MTGRVFVWRCSKDHVFYGTALPSACLICTREKQKERNDSAT